MSSFDRFSTEITGPRQAISNVEILAGHAQLTMSATELYAVLHCAAVLAEHEQMGRTAQRLHTDARLVRELERDSTVKSISITVSG